MGCEVASTTVATRAISPAASPSFSAARPTLHVAHFVSEEGRISHEPSAKQSTCRILTVAHLNRPRLERQSEDSHTSLQEQALRRVLLESLLTDTECQSSAVGFPKLSMRKCWHRAWHIQETH